jgi:hypothetical protein
MARRIKKIEFQINKIISELEKIKEQGKNYFGKD